VQGGGVVAVVGCSVGWGGRWCVRVVVCWQRGVGHGQAGVGAVWAVVCCRRCGKVKRGVCNHDRQRENRVGIKCR